MLLRVGWVSRDNLRFDITCIGASIAIDGKMYGVIWHLANRDV